MTRAAEGWVAEPSLNQVATSAASATPGTVTQPHELFLLVHQANEHRACAGLISVHQHCPHTLLLSPLHSQSPGEQAITES